MPSTNNKLAIKKLNKWKQISKAKLNKNFFFKKFQKNQNFHKQKSKKKFQAYFACCQSAPHILRN